MLASLNLPRYTSRTPETSGGGLDTPWQFVAKSRNRKSCGFFNCASVYGGADVGAQARRFRSASCPVYQPVSAAASLDTGVAVISTATRGVIMTSVNILGHAIRGLDGLYSLNDLHKAAGGEEKYQPAFFIRNDQTKELVSELKSANLQTLRTVMGRNGGTYACRELVIAYAAWISAAFHLKVIRVFLGTVTQAKEPAPTVPMIPTLPTPEQESCFHQTMLAIKSFGKYLPEKDLLELSRLCVSTVNRNKAPALAH